MTPDTLLKALKSIGAKATIEKAIDTYTAKNDSRYLYHYTIRFSVPFKGITQSLLYIYKDDSPSKRLTEFLHSLKTIRR